MIPHRLMRFVIVTAALYALPAALAAAPSNLDHKPVGVAPAAIASRPVVAAPAPAPASFGPRNTANAPASAARAPDTETKIEKQAPARSSMPNVPASSRSAAVRPAGVSAGALLMAMSDPDDPAFRAAVSAITGSPVDYFDTGAGTPAPATLATYTCVFTYVNHALADSTLLGNRLADYVDIGGKVVLGPFSAYTNGYHIGGRIMTSVYSPVVGGANHFTLSNYVGDGFKSMHAGVLAYDCTIRDILTLQGAGIANGHYADGEIAQAYRPDGRVIYSNGAGLAGVGGTGDWAKILANLALGNPAAAGMLMCPSDSDEQPYRLAIGGVTGGVVDYFDAASAVPSAALLHTYDCIYTWPNFTYFDNILMGDRIADRVDEGAKAILGTFCTFTSVNFLSGRIMTPDYCPVVSPTGTNHSLAPSPYMGDGATVMYSGVAALNCQFRDFLIGQGSGIVDGHYQDGEITAAYRPDGRVVYANGNGTTAFGGTGQWARLIGNACKGTFPVGRKLLYAPSEVDNPAFRAALAAQTGGTVDYFDATLGTPTAVQLAAYDCVYTWTNSAYTDPNLFGNRLADYVDAGGRVILGAFCTYTSGNSLGGRIMTAAYSPVTSPAGHNHFATSGYAEDGVSCFHRNVVDYTAMFRDSLVLQGAGIADAHYDDGEIALAYRPDRRVIYANGDAAATGTGDWARLLANATDCGLSNASLYGCNDAGQLFLVNTRTGGANYAALLPTSGIVGSTEIECTGSSGVSFVQGSSSYQGQRFDIGSGQPLAALVADGGSFEGLEYALGRMYGIWQTGFCSGSTFGTLNIVSGAQTPISGGGAPQFTGLAFDPRSSTMWGVTGICNGFSHLCRFEITAGTITDLGSTPFTLASLEIGPDGDLYAGGDGLEGGHLYRVSRRNGIVQFVGSPGFGGITGLTLAPAGTVAADRPAPSALEFSTPYPNPSRKGLVQFRFSMPKSGDARAELFDVAGRMVWRTAMPGLQAGPQGFSWDGRSSQGTRVASGVYQMRLVTPSGQRAVRVIRLD